MNADQLYRVLMFAAYISSAAALIFACLKLVWAIRNPRIRAQQLKRAILARMDDERRIKTDSSALLKQMEEWLEESTHRSHEMEEKRWYDMTPPGSPTPPPSRDTPNTRSS